MFQVLVLFPSVFEDGDEIDWEIGECRFDKGYMSAK